MPKRAKYVGPHDAVVLPDLINPETGYPVEVKQGQLVPAHAPEPFVESLLEQPDNWVEHQPAAKKEE